MDRDKVKVMRGGGTPASGELNTTPPLPAQIDLMTVPETRKRQPEDKMKLLFETMHRAVDEAKIPVRI